MFQICEVSNGEDLAQFINFPFEVYKDSKVWVPPLKKEIEDFFSDRNPFWKHADKKIFLAKKGNLVVGRIVAIIDYDLIKFSGEKAGYFGFYEAFDDTPISKALISSCEKWLKLKNIRIIRGPIDGGILSKIGFLLDHFNVEPEIMMAYSHKYYLEHMHELGFKKKYDFYAYSIFLKNQKLYDLSMQEKDFGKGGIKVRNIQLDNLDDDLKKILKIYNSCYKTQWGYVPIKLDEFRYMVSEMKDTAKKDLILIMEQNNNPIGMVIVYPDYNLVLKYMHGNINFIGKLKFFFLSEFIRDARIELVCVDKKFGHHGYGTYLCKKVINNLISDGYKHAEYSWVIENNSFSIGLAKDINGKLSKKYGVFEKKIK